MIHKYCGMPSKLGICKSKECAEIGLHETQHAPSTQCNRLLTLSCLGQKRAAQLQLSSSICPEHSQVYLLYLFLYMNYLDYRFHFFFFYSELYYEGSHLETCSSFNARGEISSLFSIHDGIFLQKLHPRLPKFRYILCHGIELEWEHTEVETLP